jgi:hypothetical protein
VYYLNGNGEFHILRIAINAFRFKWVNASVHSTLYYEYSKQESVSGLEAMIYLFKIT